MDLRRQLGGHIRLLREARALTQQQLASACSLSVDTLRRLERGTLSPTLGTLGCLCRGLELSLHTLFAGLQRSDPLWTEQFGDLLSRRRGAQLEMGLQVMKAMLDDDAAEP